MTCEEAKRQMMDELGHASTPALAAHVQSCPACAGDCADLHSGFAALEPGTFDRTPPFLAEAVRKQILADLTPKAKLLRALPFDGLLSILFGTTAAFASLLLLHSRGFLAGVVSLRLVAGAVVWSGVFILAFWTLLRRWHEDPQLGHLVLVALAAAGLFLAGNHFLPLPAVVQWCATRLGAGLGPLFFAMGTLYATIPLLLFATSASRRWHVRPPTRPHRGRVLLHARRPCHLPAVRLFHRRRSVRVASGRRGRFFGCQRRRLLARSSRERADLSECVARSQRRAGRDRGPQTTSAVVMLLCRPTAPGPHTQALLRLHGAVDRRPLPVIRPLLAAFLPAVPTHHQPHADRARERSDQQDDQVPGFHTAAPSSK